MTNTTLTPCDGCGSTVPVLFPLGNGLVALADEPDNLQLAKPATQPENINVCLRCLSMHRIANSLATR